MSQETVLMSERDTKRMNGFNTIRNLVESYYNLLNQKSNQVFMT
jgi:hypothetical protein